MVSDSKEGYGKIVLGNGEFYEGYFSGDRLNGEGKFVRRMERLYTEFGRIRFYKKFYDTNHLLKISIYQ